MSRAGSGKPYIPRTALQGTGAFGDLFDDDDSIFGSFTDDSDDSGSVPDVTSDELTESGPDQSAILAATGTYDASTGQVIQPDGSAASAIGIGAGIASLFSGVARIFGGGSNAQLNATGITTESAEESILPTLLIIAAAGGLLYLALQDQS